MKSASNRYCCNTLRFDRALIISYSTFFFNTKPSLIIPIIKGIYKSYIERIKEKWDEIHPEYSFLTDKTLRDQASRIEKNKDVMDTEYVHNRSNNSSQVNEPTDYRNNCFETANNSNSVSYEESQPHLEPLTITQQECFQTMKPLFERNYETINRQSITERTFSTKIIKHPSDDVLKVIDRLAKRKQVSK